MRQNYTANTDRAMSKSGMMMDKTGLFFQIGIQG
jgi:hypothetical protein